MIKIIEYQKVFQFVYYYHGKNATIQLVRYSEGGGRVFKRSVTNRYENLGRGGAELARYVTENIKIL